MAETRTYIARSGTWLTPSYSGVDSSNANRFSGRPDRIADGNLPAGRHSIGKTSDLSAFAAPTAGIGRFGSPGLDLISGPGIKVFHGGLFQEIGLHERVKMKLEAVAADALNRPNYKHPAAAVGTVTFGRITSTRRYDGNREMSSTVRLISW